MRVAWRPGAARACSQTGYCSHCTAIQPLRQPCILAGRAHTDGLTRQIAVVVQSAKRLLSRQATESLRRYSANETSIAPSEARWGVKYWTSSNS